MVRRSGLLVCLLQIQLSLAGDVRITQPEQAEEARWLASIGVTPPASPWPLAAPFALPFTSRSLVPPTAWYRERPPERVRTEEFREDVRLLQKIMETAYGGWDTAKKRGWNWDAFFQEWDASLASAPGELPLAEALAPGESSWSFNWTITPARSWGG
jgi:hypothetical protein